MRKTNIDHVYDVICLARRLEAVQDLVAYNSTWKIGPRYQEWIDCHRNLLNELYDLIKLDLEAPQKSNNKKLEIPQLPPIVQNDIEKEA